jgi:hypothetical protein
MSEAQAAAWGKTVDTKKPRGLNPEKGFGKRKATMNLDPMAGQVNTELLESDPGYVASLVSQEAQTRLMAAFNTGVANMSEELKKAIAAILGSGKDADGQADDLTQLVRSYSKQSVERYTTQYVSLYNSLAGAFGVDAKLADQPEAFGAAILDKFNALKADADSKVKAFGALEASVSSGKLAADQELAKFKAEADKAKSDLDAFIFQTNGAMKKHQAAGWDDATAAVMFQHCRAEYDKRMTGVQAPAFNFAPAMNTVQLPSNPMPEISQPVQPMNKVQAQAYLYNTYIQEQTKEGKRQFDQKLADEAIQFADSQLAAFTGQVLG